MPMLASDLMNPEFVNPTNPDTRLAVEFYMGVVKDMRGRPALDREGKEKKVPYVRISVPGDETSIVNVPAREDHKKRFPRQWQFFQVDQGQLEQADLPGWKLEDWPELSDELRHELKYLKFSVVEQLAGASDAQCQRIGPNGVVLRMKAHEALAARTRSLAAAEIAERDKKIAELEARDKERDRELAEIRDMLKNLQQPKPGRPAKANAKDSEP